MICVYCYFFFNVFFYFMDLHFTSQENESDSPAAKKRKTASYKLDAKVAASIGKDSLNAKLWEECKEQLANGRSVSFYCILREFIFII